jgi:hypothetical protein
MKTEKNLFLVLVPHRDIRLVLRKYSFDLLKTGIANACLFPQAAPLAALSVPFTKDELKQCARAIGETVMAAGNGKIFTKETAAIPFPTNDKKTFLFGPRLDPLIEQDLLIKTKNFNKKLTYFFSTQVIGCCLMNAGKNNAVCTPHDLSFRAAAVANMYWKPVNMEGASGCEWKIGELIWLPKSLTKYNIK